MSTEDLTSYTEVDPGSNISKTSSRVTLNALPLNLDSYLYKDFGANYFDAIELLFTIYFNSSSSIPSLCAAGFTISTLNDSSAWPSSSILIGLQKYDTSTYLVYFGDDSTTISGNTIYYCKLVRAAGSGTAYLYIYTNSARTTLYDTLTYTELGTSKYRYFYAACSYNVGVAGYNFYGYLENFEFLGGSGSVVPIIIHHLRQQGIM